MTAISGYGRFPQPNLLADTCGERVFLCPQFKDDGICNES